MEPHFFWLVLIFFWVWLAESAYGMLSSSLPEWIKGYAEAYQLKISGTVPGLKDVTVDGKLGGVFGLLLGLYLFLSKGMPGKTIYWLCVLMHIIRSQHYLRGNDAMLEAMGMQ